jgi:hypothetical protein
MDPITAAALIQGGTALAQGIAGSIGAKQQAEAEKRRAAQQMELATEVKERALARRKEYGMGPSYSDLRQLVLQDPTSDYLRQQAQRQEAGQMEALQAGGARAILGGTQAVAQGTMDRLAQIAQEEQIRKSRGLQVVGEAEQRIAREKLADARGDLTLGRAMTAEAEAARYAAEDLRRLAGQQMAQSAIQGLGAAGMAAYNEFGNVEKMVDPDTGLPIMWEGGPKSGQQVTKARGFRGLDPALLGMIFEDGGLVRGKTPGEFSHEENPIDIMQDGQKIGEMTGGEGVVSPEDLGKLEQLAGQGKTPLHKFVRGLIKKLESNG